jgi:hypothetical protein
VAHAKVRAVADPVYAHLGLSYRVLDNYLDVRDAIRQSGNPFNTAEPPEGSFAGVLRKIDGSVAGLVVVAPGPGGFEAGLAYKPQWPNAGDDRDALAVTGLLELTLYLFQVRYGPKKVRDPGSDSIGSKTLVNAVADEAQYDMVCHWADTVLESFKGLKGPVDELRTFAGCVREVAAGPFRSFHARPVSRKRAIERAESKQGQGKYIPFEVADYRVKAPFQPKVVESFDDYLERAKRYVGDLGNVTRERPGSEQKVWDLRYPRPRGNYGSEYLNLKTDEGAGMFETAVQGVQEYVDEHGEEHAVPRVNPDLQGDLDADVRLLLRRLEGLRTRALDAGKGKLAQDTKGLERKLYGLLYCGSKRPPAGAVVGTANECFNRGRGVQRARANLEAGSPSGSESSSSSSSDSDSGLVDGVDDADLVPSDLDVAF